LWQDLFPRHAQRLRSLEASHDQSRAPSEWLSLCERDPSFPECLLECAALSCSRPEGVPPSTMKSDVRNARQVQSLSPGGLNILDRGDLELPAENSASTNM